MFYIVSTYELKSIFGQKIISTDKIINNRQENINKRTYTFANVRIMQSVQYVLPLPFRFCLICVSFLVDSNLFLIFFRYENFIPEPNSNSLLFIIDISGFLLLISNMYQKCVRNQKSTLSIRIGAFRSFYLHLPTTHARCLLNAIHSIILQIT